MSPKNPGTVNLRHSWLRYKLRDERFVVLENRFGP